MSSYTPKIVDLKTNRIGSIERWDNGIICIKTHENSQTDAVDVKFQFDYIKSLASELRSVKILSEPGLHTTISKEARELTSKPEYNKYTKACAVVVKSVPQRLLINFIISLQHKKEMRMKVFESRERAIEWLLQIP